METKFVPEMAFAILAGVGVAFPGLTRAEDSPRRLSWAYAGEAFEDPANWTWASSSSESILSGPGAADRVFFGGMAVDKTVRFNADAVVSNFVVEATADGGTTFDLAAHTLTVSNNMSLKCDGTLKSGIVPLLTFRDGAINVVGTAKGTQTWGQPNEDAGGFFLNRAYSDMAALNLCFERAVLEVASAPNGPSLKLKGGWRTSLIHVKDKSSWTLPAFRCCNDAGDPVEFCIEDSVFKVGGDIVYDASNGRWQWLFTDGAAFQVGGAIRAHSQTAAGLAFLFDGGTHTWGKSNNSGDNGVSCSLAYTDVVVSNGAAVVAQGDLSIRSASTITVCDGASLSTPQAAKIGHQAWQNAYFGDSALVVDNGMASFGSLEIGSFARYSNNCVRVIGPTSRVEVTGSAQFNYGATVAFELPTEGYHDADGVARAPIFAQGKFGTKTAEGCRPISLELKTRAFDRANPKASVELLRATGDSTAAFTALLANVVFVDNPRNHGVVSVSEDGKALVYTAPLRSGLAVIVR